jgi:hypothetical protein
MGDVDGSNNGPKLPVEIQDMLWREASVPQTIILHEVFIEGRILTTRVRQENDPSWLEVDPIEANKGKAISNEVIDDENELEIVPNGGDPQPLFRGVPQRPDQQVSLGISHAARETTLRHYSRILQKSVPVNARYSKVSGETYEVSKSGPPILFNFDIDTLAIAPSTLRRAIFQPEEDSTSRLEIQEELLQERTPQVSFRNLKTLLEEPGNNLTNVQSIAIGNFYWWKTSTHSWTWPTRTHWQRQCFATYIRNDFQNLREFLLILSEDDVEFCTSCPCYNRKDRGHDDTWDFVGLVDPGPHEIVRKEITDMFKAEELLCPACKIRRFSFWILAILPLRNFRV